MSPGVPLNYETKPWGMGREVGNVGENPEMPLSEISQVGWCIRVVQFLIGREVRNEPRNPLKPETTSWMLYRSLSLDVLGAIGREVGNDPRGPLKGNHQLDTWCDRQR